MAALALHGGEVEGVREGAAGEQARDEEEPGAVDAASPAVRDAVLACYVAWGAVPTGPLNFLCPPRVVQGVRS